MKMHWQQLYTELYVFNTKFIKDDRSRVLVNEWIWICTDIIRIRTTERFKEWWNARQKNVGHRYTCIETEHTFPPNSCTRKTKFTNFSLQLHCTVTHRLKTDKYLATTRLILTFPPVYHSWRPVSKLHYISAANCPAYCFLQVKRNTSTDQLDSTSVLCVSTWRTN